MAPFQLGYPCIQVLGFDSLPGLFQDVVRIEPGRNASDSRPFVAKFIEGKEKHSGIKAALLDFKYRVLNVSQNILDHQKPSKRFGRDAAAAIADQRSPAPLS